MNKVFKRVFTTLASIVIMFSFVFALTACNKDEGKKEVKTRIVNLSLNPSIELIIDSNNKVLTASANNDEGNFIIASADFKGLQINAALELFLRVTKDNGYIVAGEVNVGENELKIEISGENPLQLYEKLKENAVTYLECIGVKAYVSFDKIVKADLQSLVIECMPDVDWILRLKEEDLLAKILESRQETKDMYSEELKELYYKLRAEAILQTKFDAILEYLNSSPNINIGISSDIDLEDIIGGTILEKFKKYFSDKIAEYKEQFEEYKLEYEAKFLDANQSYQQALKALIKAKKDLLEARLTTPEIDLTSFEEAVEAAKDALYGNIEHQIKGAKEQAIEDLDSVLEFVEDAKDFVTTAIISIATRIDNNFIDAKIEATKKSFYAQFNTNQNYAQEIANSKSFWNALKPAV